MKKIPLIAVMLLLQTAYSDIIMQDLDFPCGLSSNDSLSSCRMTPYAFTVGKYKLWMTLMYIVSALCILAGVIVIICLFRPKIPNQQLRQPLVA